MTGGRRDHQVNYNLINQMHNILTSYRINLSNISKENSCLIFHKEHAWQMNKKSQQLGRRSFQAGAHCFQQLLICLRHLSFTLLQLCLQRCVFLGKVLNQSDVCFTLKSHGLVLILELINPLPFLFDNPLIAFSKLLTNRLQERFLKLIVLLFVHHFEKQYSAIRKLTFFSYAVVFLYYYPYLRLETVIFVRQVKLVLDSSSFYRFQIIQRRCLVNKRQDPFKNQAANVVSAFFNVVLSFLLSQKQRVEFFLHFINNFIMAVIKI